MILFAGDSFSAWDDKETWLHFFSNKLKLDFKNTSIEGSSLWSAYSQINLEQHKILNNYYDYLIITCTNYRRIPYCSNAHMSYYTGKVEKEPIDTEEKKHNIAHLNYYEKFYNTEVHKFLYDNILAHIITYFHKHTKIILLPSFSDSLISINVANKNWNNDFMYTNFSLNQLVTKGQDMKNHMNTTTNKIFGELLADKVKHANFGPLDLTIKEIKEAMK